MLGLPGSTQNQIRYHPVPQRASHFSAGPTPLRQLGGRRTRPLRSECPRSTMGSRIRFGGVPCRVTLSSRVPGSRLPTALSVAVGPPSMPNCATRREVDRPGVYCRTAAASCREAPAPAGHAPVRRSVTPVTSRWVTSQYCSKPPTAAQLSTHCGMSTGRGELKKL